MIAMLTETDNIGLIAFGAFWKVNFIIDLVLRHNDVQPMGKSLKKWRRNKWYAKKIIKVDIKKIRY